MKLKILLDDDETHALWECALRAADEVDAWPAWKTGAEVCPVDGCNRARGHRCAHKLVI